MPSRPLKTVEAQTSAQWRAWLAKHHDSESEVWLVVHKRHTRQPAIAYEDAETSVYAPAMLNGEPVAVCSALLARPHP